MSGGEKVVRHTPVVILTHWLVAVSGLILLFSGFGEMPMYKRYMLTSVPGFSWANDYDLQLTIHYLAAAVFSAAVLFHCVYHFRRREFAIWPKRGDFGESVEVIKAMATGTEEPPHGKFLAEQRLAYVVIGFTSLLLIVTGLIKTFKNTGPVILDPLFLNIVTYAHTLATMLFMLLFFAHIGAFIIKANRPLLWSMFSGTVASEYASKRHGKWKT